MEFTPEGLRTHTEIERSAIQSQYRFNYEEVQDFLHKPAPWKKKLTPAVFQLLGHMHELAMVLRQRRLENGSLELVLPEIKLELDDEGKVCGAKVVEHNASHQIIEEFMLAANEAVAEHLTQRELLFLRRIHAPPSPDQTARPDPVRARTGDPVRQPGGPVRNQTRAGTRGRATGSRRR